MVQRKTLQILLLVASLICTVSARAQSGSHVQTTERLNLRTCPSTDGCRVIITFPIGAQLQVADAQGDWLRVREVGTTREGWVHSGYVTFLSTSPAREKKPAIEYGPDEIALFAWLLALGLTCLNFFRRAVVRRVANVITGWILVGLLLLWTQFGMIIARSAQPWIDLSSLSGVWESTTISFIDYSALLFLQFLALTAVLGFAPGKTLGRRAFGQGLASGLLIVPAFVLTLGVLAVFIWIIVLIFKVVGFLLLPLLRLLQWILEHTILPLLVWAWQELILPFLLFISPPFLWLWTHLLQPLWYFLRRYAFQPILLILAGSVALTIALTPLAVTGIVVVDGIRRSLKGAKNHHELFALGVAMGLLATDTTATAVLAYFGYIGPDVPIAVPILVGISIAGAIRTLSLSQKYVISSDGYTAMAGAYCRSSGLEACYNIAMIPLIVLAYLTAGGDS